MQCIDMPKSPEQSQQKEVAFLEDVREVAGRLEQYLSKREILDLQELKEAVINQLMRSGFSEADVRRFVEEAPPVTLRSVGNWLNGIADIMGKAYDKYFDEKLKSKNE